MKVFDAEAVHEALPWSYLIDALSHAHRGSMPLSDVVVQNDPNKTANQFITLPGWVAGGPIAVKMVGVFPGNEKLTPPQPNVQGLVALFDGSTGAPMLVADGAAMTARKTAGDSALAASLLARDDAEVLLVVGAGALAPHFARAHMAARPSLKRVLIWNRTLPKAENVAADLRAGGVNAEAVNDIDAAVAAADVITCVTMSDRTLVKGALLKPGTHLDLVGAYATSLRETDEEALKRARIFVDTRHGMENTGDLGPALRSGLITPDAIAGDHFDLAQGRARGRESGDEITIFKNVGGAHLDVFTAIALNNAA
ncbi:ornithine cyclodeaminase [Nitratireductor aestuarii]|uniref:Ornithine cyclodeaminase n=1 Tax=Nitratireductor aestuarii TaxID=1735103 RepID=A0A916RRH2_9HYPH|nr:ornithine cyclodeaminase [Nitratireductor aestuarii]GGA67640.1 ornithine cyclodeaminase [Nitratireductor aestuarii]